MPAKSSTKYEPVASQPMEKVSKNLCGYMDDVELQWLGEEDVDIHCTPHTALVSDTSLIPMGSTVNHWEDVYCVKTRT